MVEDARTKACFFASYLDGCNFMRRRRLRFGHTVWHHFYGIFHSGGEGYLEV